MKLTYWVSRCLDDAPCYNLRGKTRRDVVKQLVDIHKAYSERGGRWQPGDSLPYGMPTKVTVDYDGGLDLAMLCLSEGGGYWEYDASEEKWHKSDAEIEEEQEAA